MVFLRSNVLSKPPKYLQAVLQIIVQPFFKQMYKDIYNHSLSYIWAFSNTLHVYISSMESHYMW